MAEHISGSEEEFVALMNQKAEELGLQKTHFCNSHGLPDDNHVTSAYDIYLIMQKLFNFEEFLGIIESGSIEADVLRGESLKTLSFTTTNQFLWGTYQLPKGIKMLGGKTGTTNKAGCCLTLYVQDANGNCYIAEIFGAASYEELYSSMIQLLNRISD
jgi:D-alanyl-D-alanine carboxypeptidase (penicillin-binding protein 5/6)